MYFSTAITVVLTGTGAAAGVIVSDEAPALNQTRTHQLVRRGGFLRSCYALTSIGASVISAQCNTAAQPPTSHYTERDLNNCMSNTNRQLTVRTLQDSTR